MDEVPILPLFSYTVIRALKKASFKNYTDQLFMLRNFSGDQALKELESHKARLDLKTCDTQLRGKSRLLIDAEHDGIVSQRSKQSLARHFRSVAGLKLSTHSISDDHVFSATRIQLQNDVVNWIFDHCK